WPWSNSLSRGHWLQSTNQIYRMRPAPHNPRQLSARPPAPTAAGKKRTGGKSASTPDRGATTLGTGPPLRIALTFPPGSFMMNRSVAGPAPGHPTSSDPCTGGRVVMRWTGCALLTVVGVFVLASRPGGAAEPAKAAEPAAADLDLLSKSGIGTDGPGLVEFFRKRTVSDTDRGKIKELVRQLGADSYQARENASAQLAALGSAAETELRQALSDRDVEIVRRAEACLKLIQKGVAASVPAAAARVL